jgi:putative two-component system response regulator
MSIISSVSLEIERNIGNEPIHVLVVDDEKILVEEICEGFADKGIATTGAINGEAAISIFSQLPRGLVTVLLTDISMPGRNGLSLIELLRSDISGTTAAEVVIMTGAGNLELAVDALRAKVYDFVSKPVRLEELARAVRRAHTAAMERRRQGRETAMAQDELRHASENLSRLVVRNGNLECELRRRLAENALIKDATVQTLTMLVQARDLETGGHIQRTQTYVRILVDALRHHPRFAAELADDEYCQMIINAVPLHDIGKISIPDAILLKPGRLTPEEFEVMKTHSEIGAQAIGEAIRRAGGAPGFDSQSNDGDAPASSSLAFLEVARQIASAHHEKWDGTGYCRGLSGEDIPLAARLMAIADVFDALMSPRPYKEAFSLDHAVSIIAAGRGAHFDPDIVDTFLNSIDAFAEASLQGQNGHEGHLRMKAS